MERRRSLKNKQKKFFAKLKSNNYKIIKISLIFILVLSIVFFLANFLLLPTIKLKGDKQITLGYNEKYKESGYTASFWGKNLTKKVKVTGKVNSSKLGEYKITYEVANGIFKMKKERVVKVEDSVAPVIKLDNKKEIQLCPGEKYKNHEYHAKDNYDGDITDKVKISYESDKIIYSVTDKSGNKHEVSRKVTYEDKQSPTLKLNGNDVIYLNIGNEYIEQNATAIDNCDTEINSKIKTTGTIDSNTTGEYIITYTVTDSANNKSEIKRKVIVSEKGAKGTIYLTFDDGPKSGTTEVILDILKEEGIKATFFVTNSGDDNLIKRAYDEGHSIALHTATHDYSQVYSSTEAYFSDLETVSNRVERITGYKSKIIRFPGGSSNTISRKYSSGIMSNLTREVLVRGYRYYDWNISSGDAAGGKPSPDDIYNNVVTNLSKDKINMVLMHDTKICTRDALRNIIKYGKDNGYIFDKIDYQTEMITQRVNN